MKSKIITITLCLMMTSFTLTGCTNNKQEVQNSENDMQSELEDIDSSSNNNNKKEDTTEKQEDINEKQEDINEKQEDTENDKEDTEVNTANENDITEVTSTVIYEVPDGYIREDKGAEDRSKYYVAWLKQEDGEKNSELNISFNAISGIGTWKDNNPESGVWRYITDNEWMTIAVWNGGGLTNNEGKSLKIKDNDGKEILKDISIINPQIETYKIVQDEKTYTIAACDMERPDSNLAGSIVVLDDLVNRKRFYIQVLVEADKFEDHRGRIDEITNSIKVDNTYTLKDLKKQFKEAMQEQD